MVETMSGEPIEENRSFFTGKNALVQPHFHHACPAWYANLNVKIRKPQITQNKCIRFSPKLDKMHLFLKKISKQLAAC